MPATSGAFAKVTVNIPFCVLMLAEACITVVNPVIWLATDPNAVVTAGFAAELRLAYIACALILLSILAELKSDVIIAADV